MYGTAALVTTISVQTRNWLQLGSVLAPTSLPGELFFFLKCMYWYYMNGMKKKSDFLTGPKEGWDVALELYSGQSEHVGKRVAIRLLDF